jgi:ribose/xylose/arabinose/galactoside ABC-type transport system permease subunit
MHDGMPHRHQEEPRERRKTSVGNRAQPILLFTDVTVPLWLALAIAGILGFVAGWLIGRFDLRPGRMNRQG